MTAEIVCCRRRPLPLALGLALVCLQPACHKAQQAEPKPSAELQNPQPGLFTVPRDQLARLKTTQVRTTNWTMAIHTTGTVDWDADRTTQAISQVNGPITRILVDLGTPVQRDQPLLYVSSPDVASVLRSLGAESRATMLEMPQFGVSSSAVRERAAAGRPLRYLVPEPVARFIEEKGIYA